jgi:uncharacterized membrane protein
MSHATPPPPPPPSAAAPKKKRRVFLWVFLAVQVLFIIWIATGISSGSGNPSDCGSLDLESCNAASDLGTGIGVIMIVGVWAFVDFFMAVIYGVYRLATRK